MRLLFLPSVCSHLQCLYSHKHFYSVFDCLWSKWRNQMFMLFTRLTVVKSVPLCPSWLQWPWQPLLSAASMLVQEFCYLFGHGVMPAFNHLQHYFSMLSFLIDRPPVAPDPSSSATLSTFGIFNVLTIHASSSTSCSLMNYCWELSPSKALCLALFAWWEDFTLYLLLSCFWGKYQLMIGSPRSSPHWICSWRFLQNSERICQC